jgi:hypothetical protein
MAMSGLRLLVLVAVYAALTILPCFAEGEIPSHTSVESIKRGLLIRKLYPLPSVFDWSGHQVSFKECWVETHSPTGMYDLLCFRFLIDDSPTKEFSVQRNNNRSMDFREEGSRKKTLIIGHSVFFPLRNFAKIGKGLGEIVHYAELKDSNVWAVALMLYTINHDTDNTERTDTVLNFAIAEKKTAGKTAPE